MSEFLKNLRGGSGKDDLAAMRELATRMERERNTLEHLVAHADRSIGQLQRLSTMGDRLQGLERQMAAMEELIGRISTADEQLGGLGKTQRRIETQLGNSAEDVERIRSQMAALQDSLEAALRLREDLGSFVALDGPFRQARAETEALRAQLDTYRGDLVRMRDQHDGIMRNHAASATKLSAFEEERQRVTQSVQDTALRVTEMERALSGLAPVADAVAETRHQLASLKATADQLSQKSALLEQQREAVARTTGKVEQLATLMQQVDQGLAKQEHHTRTLNGIDARMTELTTRHEALVERTETIAEQQRRLADEEATARRDLVVLKEAIDRSMERFTLEGQGVEAVAQRLADLRTALGNAETRLAQISESSQSVAAVTAKAEAVSQQVAGVAAELASAAELGAKVRASRSDADRLEALVAQLFQRITRIEESRPLLDQTVQELASLGRTHEAIRDGLEQMQTAHAQVTHVRNQIGATDAWLANSRKTMEGLQQEVARLERMQSTLDVVRQEAARVAASMETIEARRGMVEDVQKRLADAATLGGTLEERTRAIQDRLQATDERFATLAPRTEEVAKVAGDLAAISGSLDDVRERAVGVEGRMGELEARSQEMGQLSLRMRDLATQLEQRQTAIERATEHLDRAATLRQEAAEAAQALELAAERVNEGLRGAEGKAHDVEQLARQLDARVAGLRNSEERLTAFEHKLGEWRGTEHQLALAMEQIAGRQSTIDALQAEMRFMFELAERTVADARAISDAQPMVEQTRADITSLVARMKDADGAVRSLDERRRQLDQSERRLAQAEALLSDIRSSLETLHTQKAEIDHAMAKASALTMHTRQAEAVIEALREERQVSDRVRSALASLRHDDERDARTERALGERDVDEARDEAHA